MKYLSFVLLFISLGPLSAQDAVEPPDANARHARMLQLAKSYTVTVPEEDAQVELRETPIFSWSTPERQAIGGELYLWTTAGRPLATIGIWTFDDVKDSHELQSLSTGPLEAVTSAGFAWRPRVGGLQFKKLQDAPPPGNSAVRRQSQMRNLVRAHFSAKMYRYTGQVENLRLLPQPVYRYESLPSKTIDGAMFSFAFGTDPEVFVLLEARQGAEGPVWYYAIAPSTSAKVDARIDDEVVWTNADQVPNGTFVFLNNP